HFRYCRNKLIFEKRKFKKTKIQKKKMSTKAYAAFIAVDPLGAHTIERRTLNAKDVFIKIEYCGVCHSDLHTAKSDWGPANYPAVPGHEIIGRVEAVGTDVTKFKI